MKHWINSHYKTLIISAFLIPIITVAIVSISHVTQWYGISNPISWAIYLSVGIEIAAMSALAAISANMGKNVYFPFIIVTLIQFIGNIFFAYEYIDMTSKMFQSWVELVSPLVGFMGVEPTDLIGHKRFLALFAGGLLPVISLSFLHMLVKFTEEDRLKDVKEDEEIHHKIVEEKLKHDIDETITVDPDQLKNLVEDAVRVKLSEKDLDVLEKVLLNPPKPNEALVKAANEYNDGVNDGVNEKNDGVNNSDPDTTINYKESYEKLLSEVKEAFSRPKRTQKEIEESEEKERLKLDVIDLDRLEKLLTKKYEGPYDKDLEDEFNERDVTLQDGLEDKPIDNFSSLYHVFESSDNLPIEGQKIDKSSDNLPIEDPEELDVMDDYHPVKFEADYFSNNISEREELKNKIQHEIIEKGKSEIIESLSESEDFMNKIYDEIIEENKKKVNSNTEEKEEAVEEDKKKNQLEHPSQEENIQSLPLEETQDLTNDDNSVYFEQDVLNPANINRKILSRNVNNTRRRGF